MEFPLNPLFAQFEVQPQPQPDLDPAALMGLAVFMAIVVVLSLLVVAGMWKIFTKAGEPGWAVLVPFYNIYVLLNIVGRPGWWLLLYCIPFVSLVIAIIVYYDLAKSFGKGAGFLLGMFFLPFIFFPILGFGEARYQPIKRDIMPSY